MARLDLCPNCGDRCIRAHTGSYCEECGESLVQPKVVPIDEICPRLRMGEGTIEAEDLASWLHGERGAAGERVMDQLWLRSVLITQRQRVPLNERARFDARADKCLATLDPIPPQPIEAEVAA